MGRPRFEVELEFIQSLCNPEYLMFLHKSGYFEDSVFVDFLIYLEYFKKPPFRDYIMYPLCLPILDCLNRREKTLFDSLEKSDMSLFKDQLVNFWRNNK